MICYFFWRRQKIIDNNLILKLAEETSLIDQNWLIFLEKIWFCLITNDFLSDAVEFEMV